MAGSTSLRAQRLNTTAAKMSEHPILMKGIFRDMTSAWTLVNVSKLVMQIATAMEGVNIDTAGLLGHITEEGAEDNRSRSRVLHPQN